MDSTNRYVVFFDVHEDGTVEASLRVNNQWVYVEVHPEELGGGKARKEYDDLAQAYWRQAQKEAALEQQEEQIIAEKTSEDSGYASGAAESAESSKMKLKEEVQQGDGLQALKDWVLQVLDEVCTELSENKRHKDHFTLAEWYNAPIHCYKVKTAENDPSRFSVEPFEEFDGEHMVKEHLTPHIELPKYLRSLKCVPWYKPEDLRVESEADDIHMPIHPTLVNVPSTSVPDDLWEASQNTASSSPSLSKGTQRNANKASSNRTTYFLKLANPPLSPSVKRELRLLSHLEKHSLYTKGLRAPRLAGLISLPSSHFAASSKTTAYKPPRHTDPPSHLLAFLLTLIPQPTTPLTHLMTPSASSQKRHAYAAQAEQMVEVLHASDLVWGDAKADNFLVDARGELWMIDFGGSYTPGWIDAEVADTLQGDEMGVGKIVRGLEDPEGEVEGGGDGAEEQVEVLRERGLATKSDDRSIHKRERERRKGGGEEGNRGAERGKKRRKMKR